jgi:hypothetical protein
MLIGNSHGNQYGPVGEHKRPCIFLVKEKCCIYETRPETCRKYQCAWSQGLFPEWMKPNISGCLISVEEKDGMQYLKTITRGSINQQAKSCIERFCNDNKCECVFLELPV